MPFGCVFYFIFIFKNNHKESETIKANYTYNDHIVHMKYKQRSCINIAYGLLIVTKLYIVKRYKCERFRLLFLSVLDLRLMFPN
jgi:hypothetical protein